MEVKDAATFSARKRSRDGLQTVCKACAASRQKGPAGVLSVYKARAKKAGLPFELTIEDFEECAKNHCTYCGDPLNQAAFDRVDSGVGYVLANVVPCCDTCNYMKNEFSENLFFSKAFKIAISFDPPDEVQRDLVARYPRGHTHAFQIGDSYAFEVSLRHFDLGPTGTPRPLDRPAWTKGKVQSLGPRFGFIGGPGDEAFWFNSDYLFRPDETRLKHGDDVWFIAADSLGEARNRRATYVIPFGSTLVGSLSKVFPQGYGFAVCASQRGDMIEVFVNLGDDPSWEIGVNVEFDVGENSKGVAGFNARRKI